MYPIHRGRYRLKLPYQHCTIWCHGHPTGQRWCEIDSARDAKNTVPGDGYADTRPKLPLSTAAGSDKRPPPQKS